MIPRHTEDPEQRILAYLKAHSPVGPGPTTFEVAKNLGYLWENRVRTHLKRLEREGKVTHKKRGKGCQWYLNNGNATP